MSANVLVYFPCRKHNTKPVYLQTTSASCSRSDKASWSLYKETTGYIRILQAYSGNFWHLPAHRSMCRVQASPAQCGYPCSAHVVLVASSSAKNFERKHRKKTSVMLHNVESKSLKIEVKQLFVWVDSLPAPLSLLASCSAQFFWTLSPNSIPTVLSSHQSKLRTVRAREKHSARRCQ